MVLLREARRQVTGSEGVKCRGADENLEGTAWCIFSLNHGASSVPLQLPIPHSLTIFVDLLATTCTVSCLSVAMSSALPSA